MVIIGLSHFAGESQCGAEELGCVDLLDAHGQISHGQPRFVLGNLCAYHEGASASNPN